MARAYSGVLGAIALCLVIVRGLLSGLPTDEILTHGLAVFCLFSGLGFWIGNLAQKTVSESVENRFRTEMASLEAAATQAPAESSAR